MLVGGGWVEWGKGDMLCYVSWGGGWSGGRGTCCAMLVGGGWVEWGKGDMLYYVSWVVSGVGEGLTGTE